MKLSTIKHEPPLRIKISKLINQYRQNQCKPFLEHLNTFNQKAIDYSLSKPYEKKQVIKSRNMSFVPHIPWDIHYAPNELLFNSNYERLSEEFKKELTLSQLDTIVNNKEFYLKEKELRKNLSLLPEDPLFVRLNKEDQQLPNSVINKQKDNGNLLLKNKSNFLYAENSIKSQISLDKEKRMKKSLKKMNRQHYLNKLHRETRVEINSMIYNKKKHNSHKSPLLITQNHQLYFEKEYKTIDKIIKFKKSPHLQLNINIPHIIYSPTSLKMNIPKINTKMKRKQKLPLITSPSCANEDIKKLPIDIWLWNYNQKLKSNFKEKELEKVQCFKNSSIL